MKDYMKCGVAVATVISLVVFGGCAVAPVPARDILAQGWKPASGYGAYGYLVFTSRPQPAERARYLAICKAFMANLEPVSSYAGTPKKSVMPTYWLVVHHPMQAHGDCRKLVDDYDYARGTRIASAVGRLDAPGPLLVAWRHPFEDVPDGQEALVLNLSDFSTSDLKRAFGIWKDRITRDPKVWTSGFNIVLAREAFRNFLNKYGQDVIDAVVKVKKILGEHAPVTLAAQGAMGRENYVDVHSKNRRTGP